MKASYPITYVQVTRKDAGRSGKSRIFFLAVQANKIIARVSLSKAKALDPANVLAAMAKLQAKITTEKAADQPPKTVCDA